MVESPENQKEKEKGWRELCAEAAEEPDSEKLVSLVHQILNALDEKDQPPPTPGPKRTL